jgi:hypothetical protein
MRSEVTQAVVSPVVGQAASDEEWFGDEVVYGQQLDCRDAQADQVLHHSWVRQSLIGASEVLGN